MRYRLMVGALVLAAAFTGVNAPAEAIVNGVNVDLPWAAAIARPNDGTNIRTRVYCSGVLIKPDWVLTAAHCRPVKGHTVTIGRGKLESLDGEVRTVDYFVPMPGCEPVLPVISPLCDVGLIHLDRPSGQLDLDLAGPSLVSEWGVGSPAAAYGYGWESGTAQQSSANLRLGSVEITSFRSNHSTMFAGGRSAVCFGDSGGPLLVSTTQGLKVVGVIRGPLATTVVPCVVGDDQSYVKVGSRGTVFNSPVYHWIVNTI